jgi:hypothetical protein
MAAHTCLHSVLKMQPSTACAHVFALPTAVQLSMITCHSFKPHAVSRSCHLPDEPSDLYTSRPAAISQIALDVEGFQHLRFTLYRSLGDPHTWPLACVSETVISSMRPLAAGEAIAVQSLARACRNLDYTHCVSNCHCTFSRSMCSLLTTHQAAHVVQPPCQWPDTPSLLTAVMHCTYLASVHMSSRCL